MAAAATTEPSLGKRCGSPSLRCERNRPTLADWGADPVQARADIPAGAEDGTVLLGIMVGWRASSTFRPRQRSDQWPVFTTWAPLRVLVSACLMGIGCGVDGSSYGAPFSHVVSLLDRTNVRTVAFCPEDLAFGTPQRVPDIHGGTGFDVLDRQARVLSESDVIAEPLVCFMSASRGIDRREVLFEGLARELPMTSSISAAGQAIEALTGPSGGRGQRQQWPFAGVERRHPALGWVPPRT